MGLPACAQLGQATPMGWLVRLVPSRRRRQGRAPAPGPWTGSGCQAARPAAPGSSAAARPPCSRSPPPAAPGRPCRCRARGAPVRPGLSGSYQCCCRWYSRPVCSCGGESVVRQPILPAIVPACAEGSRRSCGGEGTHRDLSRMIIVSLPSEAGGRSESGARPAAGAAAVGRLERRHVRHVVRRSSVN